MSDNIFELKLIKNEEPAPEKPEVEELEYDSMSMWADSQQITDLISDLRDFPESNLMQAAADCITELRHAVIRMDWMYVQDQKHIETLRGILSRHDELMIAMLTGRRETRQ
jgi:hypothetical protein